MSGTDRRATVDRPSRSASISAAPFSVGRVLGDAGRAWWRNLPAVLFLVAVVSTPLVVWRLGPPTLLARASTADGLVVGLADLLTASLASGAISYGVVQHLRGRRAGFVEAVLRGARSLPVSAAAGLSAALVFLLVGVGVGLLALGIAVATTGLGGAPLEVLVLAPLLVLPISFAVAARLWVAVPVAVLESVGPWECLARSGDLTRGTRWRIVGIIALLTAPVIAVDLVLAGNLGHASFGVRLADQTVALGIRSFTACVVAVGYHELRTTREGVTVEEIAQVFE